MKTIFVYLVFCITFATSKKIKSNIVEIKERIIIGSSELMSQIGIKATTMDSLASQLGISKRTIYEHFADKTNLVESMVHYLISKAEARRVSIIESEKGIVDRLFKMLEAVEVDFALNGRIAHDVKRYYPDLYNKCYNDHYEHSYNKMVEGLHSGIEQGVILKETNAKFAIFAIMESINAIMQNSERILSVTNVSPLESFRYAMIYFFRGISTPRGIDLIDRKLKDFGKN